MSLTPNITVYSLETSRSIRIVWLLEELGIPYQLISSNRAPDKMAPPEFKKKMGTFLGKSPTIVDNGVTIQESIAITEYICEYYDTDKRMLPVDRKQRAKVREFIAASEATMLLHAFPLVYTRWKIPDEHMNVREPFEKAMALVIQRDLDWLEFELTENAKLYAGSRYFVGNTLTAADTMMALSIELLFARHLGTSNLVGSGRWKSVEEWLKMVEGLDSYKRAAEKANYGHLTFELNTKAGQS